VLAEPHPQHKGEADEIEYDVLDNQHRRMCERVWWCIPMAGVAGDEIIRAELLSPRRGAWYCILADRSTSRSCDASTAMPDNNTSCCRTTSEPKHIGCHF
jgi:hypothetical protein